MNVLVVSGCSDEKQFEESPIGCAEIDSGNREELVGEFPEYVAPAADMYTGPEHGHVREAVAHLRNHANVSWRIVSAGYGILAEDDRIVAYDCSFSEIGPVRQRVSRLNHNPESLTTDETRRTLGREKNIPGDLRREFSNGFDLAFVVLSEPYLVTASDAFDSVPESIAIFAFASKGGSKHLGDAHWIPATADERAELGTTWFSPRGELLRILAESVDQNCLVRIVGDPERANKLLP